MALNMTNGMCGIENSGAPLGRFHVGVVYPWHRKKRSALIGIQSTLVRTEYLAAVVAFLSFLLLFSFFVDAVNSVENG